MAEHAIPVDLFNPGQVFACLGLLEAADILLGDAAGGFDWSREALDGVAFRLSASGNQNPVAEVLDFLSRAEVNAPVPACSSHETGKWNLATERLRKGAPFPYPDPKSPATLPAALSDGGRAITINYWGDATRRDNVKFWAGSGGYPGAALAADALSLAREELSGAHDDPFSVSAPQTSSFRFDWRRDYIPLDAGFSPNEHDGVTMIGYPLVELLAAIGLTNARPLRRYKLDYSYGVVGSGPDGPLIDPSLLRAALGCAPLPFPRREFRMRLGWPGQEGQARSIIDVSEEPIP